AGPLRRRYAGAGTSALPRVREEAGSGVDALCPGGGSPPLPDRRNPPLAGGRERKDRDRPPGKRLGPRLRPVAEQEPVAGRRNAALPGSSPSPGRASRPQRAGLGDGGIQRGGP